MSRTKRSRLVHCVIVGTVAILADPSATLAQAPPSLPHAGVSLPDSRIGTAVAPILLLTRPDVQRDLQMNADQVASALQNIAILFDRAAQLRGKNDNQAKQQIKRDMSRWISENLTPDQQKRLIQLDLQWEGPSAMLSRPIIQESLRLEDTQIKALAKAIAERNTKRNEGPAVPADEVALFKTTINMLSDFQVKNWRTILGPIAPFQVAIHPMRDNTVVR